MSLSVAIAAGFAGAVAAGAGLEVAARAVARKLFEVRRVTPKRSPADLGLAFDEVRFPTANGKMLAGWFIPAAARPAPAVAVVHGWGASAELMLPLAPILHKAGWSVLLFDARCHGRSDEDDFASMPRFAEDVAGALDWLKALPEVSALAALGHSVGGSAVILAASRRDDLAAAVAIAAFAHPEALMRRFLAEHRIPYRPLGWWVLRLVQRVIGHRYQDIAAVTVVRRVRCPLLLVHGDRDEVTPPADAELIHAARGTAAVELRIVPGAGHNPLAYLKRHGDALAEFLKRAVPVA